MSCAICGGSPKEHENSMHAYTETPGDLLTPRQKAKREGKQDTPSQVPAGMPQLARLTQVLIRRGIIDEDDLLYISFGDLVEKGMRG